LAHCSVTSLFPSSWSSGLCPLSCSSLGHTPGMPAHSILSLSKPHLSLQSFFFFFFLQSRCSTTLATPPVHFAFFLLLVLRFEHRASGLLDRHSYCLSHSASLSLQSLPLWQQRVPDPPMTTSTFLQSQFSPHPRFYAACFYLTMRLMIEGFGGKEAVLKTLKDTPMVIHTSPCCCCCPCCPRLILTR
jgi:hypothetical protein